jgi:hypothetical protein
MPRIDKIIIALTYCLLLLPVGLWLVFWHHWWVSGIVGISFGYGVWRMRNSLILEGIKTVSKKMLLVLSLLSMFVMFITGHTDFTSQSGDYLKHCVMYDALIKNHWPTFIIDKEMEAFPLVYNLLYYLVPAKLAKVFGMSVLWSSIKIWVFLHLFLIGYWLFQMVGAKGFLYVFSLAVLGGTLKYIYTILEVLYGDNGAWSQKLIEIEYLYLSGLSSIKWLPQHTLAPILLWIFTQKMPQNKSFALRVVRLALMLLLSPMVALGFVLFEIIYLTSSFNIKQISDWFIIALNLPFVLLICLYYLTNRSNQIIGWDSGIFFNAKMLFAHHIKVLFSALVFLIGLIVISIKQRDKRLTYSLIVCILGLVLISIFDMTTFNDLITKSFVLIRFIAVYNVASFLIKNSKRTWVWLSSFLSLPVFIVEISLLISPSFYSIKAHSFPYYMEEVRTGSYYDVLTSEGRSPLIFNQYTGENSGIYFEHLFKQN